MILVDGQPATMVSALDRGLNYGDGLFETMRLHAGRVPLLARHLGRLRAGCERIALPYPGDALIANDIVHLVAGGPADGIVRIVLTRGDGGRGYTPPRGTTGRRLIALHPLPDLDAAALSLGICKTRLGHSRALGGLKHLGRLEQVLAADEVAAGGWDEGLMLDEADRIVEATRHNLFFVRAGRVLTPPLGNRGVAGVMRALILEILATLGLPGGETPLRYDELHEIDELFLCNAVVGMRPVSQVDGHAYAHGETPARLRAALAAAGVTWLA